MSSYLTFKYIKQNSDVITYIKKADEALAAQGFTEHSFAHVERVSHDASMILETLNYSERECELARIAGYMHDIGNVVNRVDHAQSGAIIAFHILEKLNMPAEEICAIVSAIGNHDEGTAQPINPIAAALILADKADVRRSRVRDKTSLLLKYDIHDRVNFAVEHSELKFNDDKSSLILYLTIDTEISSVMEYFEIFMKRMLLCKKAAMYLGVKFELIINGSVIL